LVSIVVTGDGTVIATIPAGRVEDPAGNTNNASTSTDNEVTVDTQDPEIHSITSTTPDGRYGVGQQINVTVTFTEPVTLYGGPLRFRLNVATPEYVVDLSPFSNSAVATTTYTVLAGHSTADLDTTSVACDGMVRDAAGNETNSFFIPPTSIADGSDIVIETTPPTVTGVAVDTHPICDGDLTQQVTVDYNEPMNTSVKPTVAITGIMTPKSDSSGGAWNTNQQYAVTITLDDDDEDDSILDVEVSGAVDVAQNSQTPYTEINPFAVDTENPSIADIHGTPDPVSDAAAVANTFTLTVEFGEAMDDSGANDPVLSFPTEDPTNTIAFTSGSWPASDTYVATYSVVDAGETVADVDVRVTGGEDAVGNAFGGATESDVFDIDTENPWIVKQTLPYGTGIDLTDGLITDYDAAAGVGLHVIATWSERMDQGILPTISFIPAVASTLAPDSVTWQSLPTMDRVWASYLVTDANVDVDSVSIDVENARDVAGNLMVDFPVVHQFEIDTLNPSVFFVSVSDGLITDADVGDSTTFAVDVVFTEAMNGGVAPTVVFDPNVSSSLNLLSEGWVTSLIYRWLYLEQDAGVYESSVTIDIEGAQDAAGNAQQDYTPLHGFTIDTENPTFASFTIDGGQVGGPCQATLGFQARVEDAGRITAGFVSIVGGSVPTANATLGTITITSQTQDGPNAVDLTGTVDVSDLTGCPAQVSVTLQAIDNAGNVTQETATSGDVTDDTAPVIHDLVVAPHVVVNDSCEATVPFSAYVTDNCCIAPGGIAITPTNPTGNLTIDFDPATDVTVTPNGAGRVDISGVVPVRCVTSCPAIVQVTVSADDCCGNRASLSSTADVNDPNGTGHVYDETKPIPRDDPRQDVAMDESAVIDSLVEVRLDGFGVYRLVLREDTPVRIDVLTNDADNCSCDDCAHPYDPCGGCTNCDGCCGPMVVYEIVTPPAYGTATIEGAVGDCTGGSTIRFAPDRGYIGPDEFTYRIRDACGNMSDVLGTVYLQTVPEVAMEDVFVAACSGEAVGFTVIAADLWVDADPDAIPFEFSIVVGPSHGLLVGDPADVTLTPPSSLMVGGATVPTLESTETASITLVYVPEEGFIGRDAVLIRFADPFGNETTARVDIVVDACVAADRPEIETAHGEILRLIAPEGAILSASSVLLVCLADGLEHPEALSVSFNDTLDRTVLSVDTGALSPGEHVLSIPLGDGAVVELVLLVAATGSP
jgi:hypothetical protein